MKKLIVIGMGIYLSLSMMTSVFAYEDGDWQFWNTESIEGGLAENWKIKLEGEFRFGDSMGELYYHHTDGGLAYKLIDWFSLGVNYRQIYEKKKGEWEEENRPHINGTFKWAWTDFKFTDRSRLEYRAREGKDDFLRYRNKLTVKFPFEWTTFDIQPYLADEIFVDFDQGELNRNRLYIGICSKLAKYFQADVFYLWQSSKSDDSWVDYNVIGAKLKVKF